jgi:hypothetical protein
MEYRYITQADSYSDIKRFRQWYVNNADAHNLLILDIVKNPDAESVDWKFRCNVDYDSMVNIFRLADGDIGGLSGLIKRLKLV